MGVASETMGTAPVLDDAPLLRAALDASPTSTLVVDDDGRVLLLNRAARQLLAIGPFEPTHEILGRRHGDLLRCLNALSTPDGCGRSAACSDCTVRNAMRRASAGEQVARARGLLHVERPAGVRESHFLLSASPVRHGGKRRVILTLEDLTELVKLSSLLPICFHCRKVRDERHYWTTVEEYFKTKADVDFTHTLCDDCLEKHYPSADPSSAPGDSP